jgi:deoxyadenosine/deoxycytidine kinase
MNQKNARSGLFIAIAGNIGSGKTTLTQKLSESFGWQPKYESVEDNPYLDDFYADMNRFSFPIQIHFLNHRFRAHKEINNRDYSAIQDRTIYEDANIFARSLFDQGFMSARDYENYLGIYETVINYLTPPDLMVYLRKSTPKLMDRIKLRGRECESSIQSAYLSRLNQYYDEWMASYKLGPCVTLDTDEMDFLNSPDDYRKLLVKINQHLPQLDLFNSAFAN